MKQSFFPTRAFTLIELLVVVSIIGILAALGVAGYSNAIRASKSSGCMSNLQQITAATLLYAGDHDGTIPQGDLPISWDVTLQPYLGGTPQQGQAVFRCPGDPRPLVVTPGGYWQTSFARSYAISGVDGNCGVSGTSWNATTTDYSRKLVQLTSAPKTILFAECYAPANYQFNAGYSWTPAGIDTSFYPAGQLTHGARMNFAFVDGHVESLTVADAQQYWQAVP